MSQIRGRFKKAAHESVQRYTASIEFDWRLATIDIMGSIAHAKMLARQGIITTDEGNRIIQGLGEIAREIEQDKFEFKQELEDIHMNIEASLIAKIGEVGRKLHTARSRNDQVATDTRLYVMTAVNLTITGIRELQTVLVQLAEKNADVIMPGYTHLQRAQPVSFAHHLLAYFEMLERDVTRFYSCLNHTSVLPLGSGALAGVPYDIDREFVAKELGFEKISHNSIDAVSDRDFILEYEFAASTFMMHLSRLAQEITLWASAEFDFIDLDEAFTTGSSIMLQKKNPDVAELSRGKTGRVYGNLLALLTTMKGLPLAYNTDMQEDKEGLFQTVGIVLSTIEVFNGMLATMRLKTDKMAAGSYLLATDIADYLVHKGETFRSAHEITGKLVQYAIEKGRDFPDLTLEEYQKFSSLFGEDVFGISALSSIDSRNNYGGTARRRVGEQIRRVKQILKEYDEP